jgi:hypothetical protein
MALEPLEIQIEVSGGEIRPYFRAMFNPAQLSFSSRTSWSAVRLKGRGNPQKQFGGGEGTSLNIEFFFDSYEAGGSVREAINRLRQLLSIDPVLGHPPKCLIFWGAFGGNRGKLYAGMLESIQETYTMFRSDGTPVRATVHCNFTEFTDPQEEPTSTSQQGETSTVVANSGDTLSTIASRQYNDPGAWRPIAEANNIDDPLELPAGSSLVIPPQAGGLG